MKKTIIYIISFLLLIISMLFIYKTLFSSNTSPTPIPQNQSPTPTPEIKKIETKEPSTIELHNSQQKKYIAPSPTPDPQTYACDPAGNCNSYQNPTAAGCPITFNNNSCDNKCYDLSIRCQY